MTIKRKLTYKKVLESFKKTKPKPKRKLSEREIKACKVWGKNLRLINLNTIT